MKASEHRDGERCYNMLSCADICRWQLWVTVVFLRYCRRDVRILSPKRRGHCAFAARYGEAFCASVRAVHAQQSDLQTGRCRISQHRLSSRRAVPGHLED